MAERRMFAKTIVTSDAFLDMPATSRSLYMLLCVLADDDGFVNAPRSIMRQSGATEDDMKPLIAKRFILTFQSGVIVIKHWKIHNLIQKDRYKETKYLDEKSMLVLDENNAYTEASSDVYPACIQDVSNPLPQDRLGKDRLGKVREDICASGEAEASVSYQKIIEMFHTICKSFPKVRSLSEARRKAIRARLKTYSVDDFKTVFQNAEDSSFLKGKNDRNWQANFDWLIADKNMAKVLEGQYADRGKKEKLPDWFGRRELDEDEVAAINRMLSEPDDETEQLRRELQSLGGRQ